MSESDITISKPHVFLRLCIASEYCVLAERETERDREGEQGYGIRNHKHSFPKL